MKIGVFDSGLGGLEILKAIRTDSPQYDYVYYGNTAHVPYGNRSEEQIYELTVRGVEYLFNAGARLVIIACNTASAETARKLQQEFIPRHYPDRKVLGVIVPTVEEIIARDNSRVVLVATIRTVESKKYDCELEKLSEKFSLISVAVPALVPLIEAGALKEAAAVLEKKLSVLEGEGHLIVMGCTHYSVLENYLSDSCKKKFDFLYQTKIIPRKLTQYFEKHADIESALSRGGSIEKHFTAG
jgi:glutamate racemase